MNVNIDFARGKWKPEEWLAFKSLRWEYTGSFEQLDDHIVNRCPTGIPDEELYASHVTELYASMVYPQRIEGTASVSSTMSFDHLMAPLIVLTPELDKDDRGRHAFKQHYEVVLYREGINVWHYSYDGGRLDWHLAAFARRAFEPGRPYRLTCQLAAGKREMRMTVSCDGVTFGFEDPCLPRAFYAGVTGCEGRCRFYDFSVETSDARLDPAADGEH